MKRLSTILTASASAALLLATATPAGAAATNSQSPNLEEPFPVVCDGTSYTLVDAPANPDHAEFTPAFVVDSHVVVIPYVFDTTQEAIVLTDGAVFDGVTYNSGDFLFSGSESSGIGTKRHGCVSCTFGGTGVDTFTDDNGMAVEIQFTFAGTAMAKIPNRR